ncbi:MAG TPA: hypothetical protein VGM12_00430 [Trebonia sp.]|jgi:hypothetical protein
MTLTDWIIDIALVLVVLRQLREGRLTVRTFLLPLALIIWAGSHYLHGVPTAGNDMLLIALLTAVGAVFGLFGGLLTRVRSRDGGVFIKATWGAAALWVLSMGFRMAFAVWSSYSFGAAHVASFSAAHDITSAQAWVTALVLMAFGEVVVRLGVIFIRGQIVSGRDSGRDSGTVPPARAARVGTRF